jgi:predicted acyltransferase
MFVKPGYKTTEFLVTVLLSLGALLASLTEQLPPKYAALASAVSVAAYSVARGMAKKPSVVATAVTAPSQVTAVSNVVPPAQ